MREIPLIDDPRVLEIPIEECGEPLVDLCDYPVRATMDHPRANSPAETRLHCREGVAERLVAADAALPDGVSLLVLECHRPLELQRIFWDTDLAALKKRHPEWSDEKLSKENARFVAPPWSVPPHSTGGAVDLILRDSEENELDMGSLLNQESTLMRTDAENIPDSAKKNRQALVSAMQQAGFANYGHEWWHYSYGDRYWAFTTNSQNALYGSI